MEGSRVKMEEMRDEGIGNMQAWKDSVMCDGRV